MLELIIVSAIIVGVAYLIVEFWNMITGNDT